MSEPTYDFIIIGAGSTGCVLANRLSANPSLRVLLLEAGPKDRNPWIHIPVGYYRTMDDARINWHYRTETVPETADRKFEWPRGKVLGGCSSINGLVYARGQAEDFDHWRQLGNVGWSFSDVLPYFRRAEGASIDQIDEEYHGRSGPLGISRASPNPLCDAYIAAGGRGRHTDQSGLQWTLARGCGVFPGNNAKWLA